MWNIFKLGHKKPVQADSDLLFVLVSQDRNGRAIVKPSVGGGFMVGFQLRANDTTDVVWERLSDVSRFDDIRLAREDATKRIEVFERHQAGGRSKP
jgi:hypothetical protein